MLICQLTDLHVRPKGQTANRVSETNMMTERAFRAVAAFRPRPDVVLITGDLTECGLSSLDMVNLMLAVESEFDVKIPDRDMTPSNFRTKARIDALVGALLPGA